jgi:predicted ATPase
LAELSHLIVQPDCHLLTIIGPGGVGKTQLALTVAAACDRAFLHGVCFVPLAPLTTSEFIVPAIAHALNFSTSGPAEPKTQLLNYLHEKELLLVLDNLEHLLSDISMLAEILRSTLRVKLLATSRERLNLQGEWVFELHSLPTPTLGQTEEIEKISAVQLFLNAAQRQRFGFTLTEQNREDVARICRLVDGMPLGLELAAAWTHVLSCQEIANEIEGSLDFLTVPARDRPERHRSLRAVFDHSWRLLGAEEQRALRQLSVFRGSFGREAAEQVAGATLPILSALTDKSLLHRTDAGRYDLHELIRQYSALKLNEAHEETDTRQRHFDYYLSLVESAAPHLTTAEWKPWLDRLEAEHDNLRTALGWCQVQTGSSEPLLRLAGALYWFWYLRGDLSEGRTWLESAIAHADDTVVLFARARALYGAGHMAYNQGDNALA